MKISQVTKYDPNHKCETPDAIYSSDITDKKVSMSVKLPFDLNLSKEESQKLEAQIHYAFEEILSKYF